MKRTIIFLIVLLTFILGSVCLYSQPPVEEKGPPELEKPHRFMRPERPPETHHEELFGPVSPIQEKEYRERLRAFEQELKEYRKKIEENRKAIAELHYKIRTTEDREERTELVEELKERIKKQASVELELAEKRVELARIGFNIAARQYIDAEVHLREVKRRIQLAPRLLRRFIQREWKVKEPKSTEEEK